MMFGYGAGGWPVWAMALMWAGLLVVLGILIWGGYRLLAGTLRRPHQDRPDQAGLQEQPGGNDTRLILDERLARGQIDASEYQSLLELIAAGDGHVCPGQAGVPGTRVGTYAPVPPAS
jgi:uncharacterized membrane protein